VTRLCKNCDITPPVSVQLKSEINHAFPCKRHQMRHFSTVCYEREGRGPESPDAATLITEGWLTSWAHWVQERCFESGAQSQCPSFLLLL